MARTITRRVLGAITAMITFFLLGALAGSSTWILTASHPVRWLTFLFNLGVSAGLGLLIARSRRKVTR